MSRTVDPELSPKEGQPATTTLLSDAGNKHVYHVKGEANNGAERMPLCEKSDVSLALYEDEYNTQGQKIGQMLRSLSLYQTVPPKSDDVETSSTQRAPKQVPFMFFELWKIHP